MLLKALLVSLLIYFILRAAFRLIRVIANDGQSSRPPQVRSSRPSSPGREPAPRQRAFVDGDVEDAVWKDL